MRGPPPLPEGTKDKLQALLEKSQTKSQYKQVLCLWLRASLGLNSQQVGVALGWAASAVRRVQGHCLREGEAIFKRPGRGGRRRQNLTQKAERELLQRALEATFPNGVLESRMLHEAYEKEVGHPVSKSVIYRMLSRNNWRRVALGAVIPGSGWAAARGDLPAISDQPRGAVSF